MTSDPSILGGRYELGAILGRGGMADVVRAHDLLLDRAVAVKLLREGNDIDRERFASEAQLLAMLNHPNVVSVLDAGVHDDRPWLVLELIEGAPLDQWLVGEPPTASRIAAIGAQVAEALAHAHAHDIVHRDVKPANVLIAPGDRAKLSDFGIARRTDSATLTVAGHTVGTVAYLAPEQVAGQAVSTPADIYALGLVLLEALTGRREYEGPAAEAAFARLQRSPTVPASLPTGWPSLISTMTAKIPADRPTATAVAARLMVLGGHAPSAPLPPPTVEVPSASGRAGRRRQSGPVIAASVAAGLLLTTAVVVPALLDDERAAPAGVASSKPEPSAKTPSPPVASAGESVAATLEPSVATTPATSPTAQHRGPAAKHRPPGRAKAPKAKGPKIKGPKPKKPSSHGGKTKKKKKGGKKH